MKTTTFGTLVLAFEQAMQKVAAKALHDGATEAQADAAAVEALKNFLYEAEENAL
jgi:hypothetical protein